MGIERSRVVEVHSRSSLTGAVGSGYLVSDRLVLTSGRAAGRQGSTDVRPAGTAVWAEATLVWSTPNRDAALLEVDDPSALMVGPGEQRWGQVAGSRPVAVTATGFPPAAGRPERARDPEQFFGNLSPADHAPGGERLMVTASGGRPPLDGMCGAALFAGADLVGVLLAGPGLAELAAVPSAALAGDPVFVGLVGRAGSLALTPVHTSLSGFPILGVP